MQSTGSRVVDSVVVAYELSCPAAVQCSRTRESNHVPCIGRQIPNHRTTREVQKNHFVVEPQRQEGLARSWMVESLLQWVVSRTMLPTKVQVEPTERDLGS